MYQFEFLNFIFGLDINEFNERTAKHSENLGYHNCQYGEKLTNLKRMMQIFCAKIRIQKFFIPC